MSHKLSIIVPSYNCKYASKTVDDIFKNATGNIEVVVILDGYCPDPPVEERENLVIIHSETNQGMRHSINTGVSAASGDYILKTDDHCSFSKGFDQALIENSQDHQVSIPSRRSLDVVNWQPIREPVEYSYAAYPYVYYDKYRYGIGLFSKKWEGVNGNDPINRGNEQYYWMENHKKHIKIDEIMIFPGACWFMSKNHFYSIGGLDENLFKTLYQEPQEISFKTWLSGGRVVVNKNCWYAHMHKGKDFGDDPNIRGYRLDLHGMRETERIGTYYWMNDKYPHATRSMKWLIEKFWPIPGWPEDWEEQKRLWNEKYPVFLPK